MGNNEIIHQKVKKITFGERINFAQTELDEINLTTIMNSSSGGNITASIQMALQLYADLVRTHKIKETMCLVSRDKTMTIEKSKHEIDELKAEIERLKMQ